MDLLTKLRERRVAAFSAMKQLADDLQADETRTAFTPEDGLSFDALKVEIDELDQRIADFEAIEARTKIAAEAQTELGNANAVVVGTEPRTYTPETARRDGVSFLRDLANAKVDPNAAERIARHQREAQLHELRDVGTGAFAGLTVPVYLTDMVAPARRAGRPTADICNIHPLPTDGMTVNISRITTGSAAAAQATENSAVQETNIDDTLLTVNVRTYAGMQDVSRQAIERSTGVESIVMQDLVAAYNEKLNDAILNADGTAGTHLGIRSTGSITSQTYTDASPTAAEVYTQLAKFISAVQSSVFLGISHFVMAPRRWWWLASNVGTSFPLLQAPMAAPQMAGQTGDTQYGSDGRFVLGVPVVLDAAIPLTVGAGTEDVILGVTNSELHLWEDPAAPLFIRTEDAIADALTVRYVLYGYSAFTAGRYPAAHGLITGTGLIAPVF